MPELSVWAPDAHAVSARLASGNLPMRQVERGWWLAESEVLTHGTDYQFIVDGRGPYPDPRSPWQPNGVHGASRILDHPRFQWRTREFAPQPFANAIIYELHIGTFSHAGTFDGAIAHLPHLARLGVTHLELLPVAQFPGSRGWGYDGVDLFAPHNAYGGPEALKSFIDSAHQHNLAVIIDVVYNHLGPDGNYLSQFGPYFSDRRKTPWGDAVNIDGPHGEDVRRFFIDNALMWLKDYRADGLRLDAIHAIRDTAKKPFLRQLSDEVRSLSESQGREFLLIAESVFHDPRVASKDAAGYGFDAQWADDFHHSLHAVLTHESSGYYEDFGQMSQLADALISPFLRSERAPTPEREAGPSPEDCAVVFLQNHDQVGNRARGERIGHLVSADRAKIGAALALLSPHVPMLFAGEEWGASTPFQYFTDHQDADLASAVRKGRIAEFAAFGWNPDEIPDPQSAETFLHSKLDWKELHHEPHASLLEWYIHLIELRKSRGALSGCRAPNARVEFDEEQEWLLLYRDEALIACNLAPVPRLISVRLEHSTTIALASKSGVEIVGPGSLLLPPETVAILLGKSPQ
ncbi:malto-oligosyltrehalose trehalohydrolase [soil metagenome]